MPPMKFARIAYLSTCAVLLASCGRQPADQLQWAEAALARNPTVEVLASDAPAGIITIRIKSTGEVRTVKLNELAAAPVFQLESALPVTAASGNASSSQPASPASVPPQVDAATTASAQAATPADQTVQRAAPAVASAPSSAQGESAAPPYTVERSNGRVRVSGPGVSIIAEKANPSVNDGPLSANRHGLPIVCEGRRSMHIDMRTIEIDGNAVMASGGCDLYITNSHLSGTDSGIVIRDATVHIDNSTVSGSVASVDADNGAKLYTRGTTYHGLLRSSGPGQISDLGGNVWR